MTGAPLSLGAMMNPTISVPIMSSPWYSTTYHEPGQPGVFEVDSVTLDDTGAKLRRFSFWDGKWWGAVATSPSLAYTLRFRDPQFEPRQFRGLLQPAA
jgi:hypothetical protein